MSPRPNACSKKSGWRFRSPARSSPWSNASFSTQPGDGGLMKITIAVWTFLLLGPASAFAQGARLQLDHLDRLAGLANESVNIAIDPAMLKLASAFLKAEGDRAAVKEMLAGIKGIYVRSF